mmetsp:Transcript_97262/g.119152  ORF Transcript_97262/g.119152 Transcript_97262/m.119152 type:complete len:219 (-) Transcript_97262:63-719(-)
MLTKLHCHGGLYGLCLVDRRHGQHPQYRNLIFGTGICVLCKVAAGFVGHGCWTKKNQNANLVGRKVVDTRMTMPASAVLEIGSNTAQAPMFQVILVLLCAAIPVLYWWFVIVPFKRRELAASKARGPMKQYLQELAALPQEERKQEKWFYDKYLRQAKLVEPRTPEGLAEVVQVVEDELQESLPGGGFWSFDNPIFVCLVMLALFCMQQVLLHDVFQS